MPVHPRRFAPAFALLLLFTLPAVAELRIVTPRHLSFAVGETRVEVAPVPPAGVSVRALTIEVDGATVARLTEPPWVATFDAGDGSRGHRVVATVEWSDGSLETARVSTSRLRINQEEEVDLVNLFPIVRDRRGNYVPSLTRDDFEVYENGVRQTISAFSAKGKPLRMAVVLDTSESMKKGNRLEQAKDSALSFLNAIEPQDRAMLVTFSDDVRVDHPMTDDLDAIEASIEGLEASGGTALYDAIWRASRELKEHTGRRVLVLLSDGRDQSASGLEPGSLHTSAEALEEARRGEVIIFAIGLGRGLERVEQWHLPLAEQLKNEGETTREYLDRVAETTGGRAFFSARAGQLRRAFGDVAEALRAQYLLAYSSSDRELDGSWRTIEVRVPRVDDVEVRCRDGYYAVSSDERDPAATNGGGSGTR